METADNKHNTSTQGRSKSTGIVIGGVIALTLLAVWLVPGDQPQHEDIPMPAAVSPAANPVVNPVTTPDSTAEAAVTPTAPVSIREGDIARDIIATARQDGAAPDDLYLKAVELTDKGQLADAHILYFEAARLGHAGASMALARQADPAFYSAGSSVLNRPDVTQARKWYLAAANAGDDTAAKLLANLHTYVQAQALAGDPDASRLLLQWK